MPPTKKSKHVDSNAIVERDDLALLLNKELNKSNKDGSKASFFLDEDDNPSQVVEWCSTGSTLLDLAISNRPHGGLPVGRITELSGLEGTGKSLVCAHIIAETDKKNGLSVFFDSEFAVDRTFWKSLGVNLTNVNYVPFTTLEELFNKLEMCIGVFRKSSKDRLLTIFIDSVAGASIEKELEAEHGIDGYNTGKSLILGKAMRKIAGLIARQRILLVFTNQVRYNMNAGPFGDKWITPGGKALPFTSSVRIRTASLGKLKRGDDVIGMKAQAQVIKNRCGPNYRFAEFEIHYDSGIQDLSSWLKFMKEHGIVTGDGHGYNYKSPTKGDMKFKTAEFVELMNTDPALKEEIYQTICEKYCMQYRDPNSAIIENVVETNTENDDISKNVVKDEE